MIHPGLSAVLFASFVFFLAKFLSFFDHKPDQPEFFSQTIIKSYPTDPTCFLQGLVLLDSSHLLQSCGMFGESRLQISDFFGQVNEIFRPPKFVFLEGLAISGNSAHVLTWKNRIRYTVSLKGNNPMKSPYPLEGWGMATRPDESGFVTSNGTEYLTFFDERMQIKSTCAVLMKTDGRYIPVNYINHLTWSKYDNLIYANIYAYFDEFNYLLGIDSDTCAVIRVLEMRGLHQHVQDTRSDVFNGAIALSKDTFLVSGKNWGRIYEIQAQLTSIFHINKLVDILLGPNPLG